MLLRPSTIQHWRGSCYPAKYRGATTAGQTQGRCIRVRRIGAVRRIILWAEKTDENGYANSDA